MLAKVIGKKLMDETNVLSELANMPPSVLVATTLLVLLPGAAGCACAETSHVNYVYSHSGCGRGINLALHGHQDRDWCDTADPSCVGSMGIAGSDYCTRPPPNATCAGLCEGTGATYCYKILHTSRDQFDARLAPYASMRSTWACDVDPACPGEGPVLQSARPEGSFGPGTDHLQGACLKYNLVRAHPSSPRELRAFKVVALRSRSLHAQCLQQPACMAS